jgi:hypothetical protein
MPKKPRPLPGEASYRERRSYGTGAIIRASEMQPVLIASSGQPRT